jgi:hypothetical protein
LHPSSVALPRVTALTTIRRESLLGFHGLL